MLNTCGQGDITENISAQQVTWKIALRIKIKIFHEISFIYDLLSKSKKTSYFWGVQQVDSSRAKRLKSLPIVSV